MFHHCGSVLVLLVALLLSSGCAGNRHVTDPQPESATIDRLHRQTSGRDVDIRAKNGQQWLDAQLVWVAVDTTAWIDKYGASVYFPTAGLESITYRRRGVGALHGLGAGVGLAGIGAGIGALTYSGPDDFFFPSRGGAAAFGGLLTGVFTAPIGLLFGRRIGQRVTYHFAVTADSTRAPLRPAPNRP